MTCQAAFPINFSYIQIFLARFSKLSVLTQEDSGSPKISKSFYILCQIGPYYLYSETVGVYCDWFPLDFLAKSTLSSFLVFDDCSIILILFKGSFPSTKQNIVIILNYVQGFKEFLHCHCFRDQTCSLSRPSVVIHLLRHYLFNVSRHTNQQTHVQIWCKISPVCNSHKQREKHRIFQ